MSALWTHDDAARATGGMATRDWRASGVSIDSRSVARGDLFVALKGPSHDGHDYVEAALEAGAAAAMVRSDFGSHRPDLPLLVVGDTLNGLWDLGRAARARLRGRAIAVTGSVGKTGTKEALALALGRQGATHASQGNLNNHYGAPLSVSRMPARTDFAVFELGMDHAGEIEPMSRLVRPQAAIVTTVEAVHIENFDDETGIADAKAEIFAGLEGPAIAILNRDNRHFDRLVRRAREAPVKEIWSFGAAPEADIRLTGLEADAEGSWVDADIAGSQTRLRVGAPGRHWALNSLAVLAGVKALGADVAAAAAALADIRPPKGRGAREDLAWPGGAITLFDESYNASPPAVRAALTVLGANAPGPSGRRVLVLGDMLELGPNGPRWHADLAGPIAEAGVDRVHACGPLCAHLMDALPPALRGHHAPDSAALAPLVAESLRPGDLVTVKGSLGSRMAVVVAALRGRAAAPRKGEAGRAV